MGIVKYMSLKRLLEKFTNKASKPQKNHNYSILRVYRQVLGRRGPSSTIWAQSVKGEKQQDNLAKRVYAQRAWDLSSRHREITLPIPHHKGTHHNLSSGNKTLRAITCSYAKGPAQE